MSIFSDVIGQIDSGRTGANIGLSMGFPKLSEYLPNIQKKTFYLLGAKTKVGKTTLADDMFVYNPYDDVMQHPDKQIDLEIDYFTFEVDKISKILRGITRKLYKDYGICVDTNYVLSKGKNRVAQEIYDKVLEQREYFDQFESMVTMHDMPETPSVMFDYLKQKARQYGKEYTTTKTILDPNGREYQRTVIDKFVTHSPNKYHIVLIDHVSLIESEKGFTTKQSIDKLSSYLVQLRNGYGIIPVVVQQLAFNTPNIISNSLNRMNPRPVLEDFSDSRYTSRDANVILGLYSPHMDQKALYRGYNIDKLGNHFRDLEIIVNRDGEPNVLVGLFYNGRSGSFSEMPRPEEIEDITRLIYPEITRIN